MDICNAKEAIGFGIKDLSLVNLAQLNKLRWTML